MDCVLYRAGIAHLIGDDLGYELGIGIGAEDLSPTFELVPQCAVIDKVSVMGQGDDVIPEYKIEWLVILRSVLTGGRVPDMTYPHVSFQAFKCRRIEYFGNQALCLVFVQPGAIERRNSRALLPPVLESIKSIINREGNTASIPDANDTAHECSLVGGDFWFLCQPLVLADPGASTKTACRADLMAHMVGDAPAPSTGDVAGLVPFSL